MLRRIISLQTLFFCLFNLTAQAQSNVKLKVEAGFDILKPGVFFNIEPKVKSTENTTIGLRFGLVGYAGSSNASTINTQTTGNNSNFKYTINEQSGNGIVSFVPTFDYYLNENIFLDKYIFRPYLGVGVGYYLLGAYIEVNRVDTASSLEDEIRGKINNQVGVLLRGGIELDKLIIGLEYNFTPKADIKIPNGQKVGVIDLSFVGLSFGFKFGFKKYNDYPQSCHKLC